MPSYEDDDNKCFLTSRLGRDESIIVSSLTTLNFVANAIQKLFLDTPVYR